MPPEQVPDFVVEHFEEHDPDTLRNIVAYEAQRARSTEVPKYITEAFVMQNDETKRAIASYARDLAAHKEQRAEELAEERRADAEAAADGGEPRTTESEQATTDSDDDSDRGPSFTTGPMFG
jgi:glycerol-3-phosphate cytidylyltransferase-like family protein